MNQQSLYRYFSKWSVSFEQEIEVSVLRLWEIISMPGHLEKFHPYCKKNEAIKWPGLKSQDILTYLNGKTYKREILEWNTNESFSLFIGEFDGPKSFVKWEFIDNKKNTKVKITIYPHLLINWPIFLSYIPYKWYISPKLKSYLKAVLSGLKLYAEKAHVSKVDMQASHPWFS